MSDKIIIYDNGQTYEIDSDLIYVPSFLQPAITKKINAILPDNIEFQFEENKNDTESKDKTN